MVDLNRKKIYDAIYDFLSETMVKEKALNQTNIMIDNILETLNIITEIIKNNKNVQSSLLSKNIHTLKNLLLYGDFYYESDLCQDIEIELRKSKKISNIISLYDELIDSLRM